MRVYYLTVLETPPDRHRVNVAVHDKDVTMFAASALAPGHASFEIDEIPANRADIAGLLRSLSIRQARTQPPWQFVDGGRFRRSDGTLWTPAVNVERKDLVDSFAGMRDKLNDIITGIATPNEKDLARVSKRLLLFVERFLRGE